MITIIEDNEMPFICPLGCGLINKDKVFEHQAIHMVEELKELDMKMQLMKGVTSFSGDNFINSTFLYKK